jgi:WD40 repeat protein
MSILGMRWAAIGTVAAVAGLALAGCGGQSGTGGSGKQSGPKVIHPRFSIDIEENPKAIVLDLSSDGKHLVGGTLSDSKNVQLWDLDKRQLAHALNDKCGVMASVAISPDGKTAAYVSPNCSEVPVIEVDSGKELRRLRLKESRLGPFVASLHFSRAGDLLVTASNNDVVGWDPRSGEERFVWHDGEQVRTLSDFFDGGKKIASGGPKGTVKVWDVATGKPIKTMSAGGDSTVVHVAASDDGTVLVSCGAATPLTVWDPTTGAKLREINISLSGFGSVLALPGGKTFAYSDAGDTVRLLDATTGETTHILQGHKGKPGPLAVSHDGSTLVSAGEVDKTIKAWDLKP